MHSSSFQLIFNIAAIPAAYLYGTGFSFENILERYQQWHDRLYLKENQILDTKGYACQHPAQMRPKFLAYDPIMVYIEGFLTEFESDYLKQLANPLYEESEVRKYEDDGSKTVNIDRNHRKSDTAWLPSEDPVVSCVRERAAEFEGYAPANGTMDALAAVRYKPGGRFGMHHDWDTDRKKDVDRRTSFFATLESDNCTGGSTYFPLVRPAWGNSKRFGRPWCRWTDCDFEGDGVAVRPIKGNALFWVNFREDGTGIHETIHAGQPLLEGTKIGMNIWTHGLIGAEGGGLRDD